MARFRMAAAVLGVCAVVLAGCGGTDQPAAGGTGAGAAPQGLTKVKLLIDFFPNGNHALFHAAKHLGYFAEEGLDVEIQHILGGTEVVKSVAVGQAEFGYADYATMAVARHRGQELTAVFGIQQQTPMAIVAKASAGIEKPADLVGKTVVDFAGSSTQIVWPIFLEENHLPADKVGLQLVDAGSRLPLVVQGRADAAVAFYPDNVPTLASQCKCEVKVVAWKDFGIHTLSNGLFVSSGYAKENGKVVAAFNRALAKALGLAGSDPQKTASELKAALPDVKPPVELVAETVKSSAELARTSNTEGKSLGTMALQDWQSTLQLMLRTGQISSMPDDVESYFTNEFIPEEQK